MKTHCSHKPNYSSRLCVPALQETHFKYYKFIVLWNGRWEFHGLTVSWSAPECNHKGEGEWGEESGWECVTTEQDSSLLYKTFCLPKTNKKKEQKLYHTFVPNMEWTDGMIRYQLSAGMACPSFYKKKYITCTHQALVCPKSHHNSLSTAANASN